MSSRTRKVLQTVIGLGLAAAMLIWGLPYFAKTSWADIWTRHPHHPAQPRPGLPGADAARAVELHLHLHRVAARAEPRQGAHREPVRVVGLEPAARRRRGRARGDLRHLPVVGLLAPGHVDVGHRHRGLERAWPASRCRSSRSARCGSAGSPCPAALTDLAVAGMFTGLGILAAFVAIMASERAAQAIGRGLDRVLGPTDPAPSGQEGGRRRRRGDAAAGRRAAPAEPPMSIEELVTDLRARINDVVGSGWLSMTLGMVGFFGAYYVLFVLIMREHGRDPAAQPALRGLRHRAAAHRGGHHPRVAWASPRRRRRRCSWRGAPTRPGPPPVSCSSRSSRT